MVCRNCGYQNTDTDRYCGRCGHKLMWQEGKAKEERELKMKFSDELFAVFRQNLEGKGILPEEPVQEELSSRKMFFHFEEAQRIMPFNFDRIYICEPQKGNLTFGDKKKGMVHAVLTYKGNRWYITASNKQLDVWLSGVRLKYGQEYLVHSGDQITLKEMVSFTVQCHSDGVSSQNRIEKMLNDLEQAVEVYAKSHETDDSALERIMEALLHVPLFCWGGYRPDPVNGKMESFIQAIPANCGKEWRPTPEVFDKLNRGTREKLCVPVFTTEEQAVKGDCPLGAFPYDFPLPIFNKIVKMDVDVVINPFSDCSVTIPKCKVKELWTRIQELNNTKDCPAPDWRMHSKLAGQMQNMENGDDLF